MTAHRFGAHIDVLDDALVFVEAFCVAEAIAHDDALRLRLVVEELFTNTVEHGGDAASWIEIDLVRKDMATIALDVVDDGAPFDPRPFTDAGSPVAAEADAAPVRVGGIGLKLVGRWCSRIDYVRDPSGRNRVRLELRLRER